MRTILQPKLRELVEVTAATSRDSRVPFIRFQSLHYISLLSRMTHVGYRDREPRSKTTIRLPRPSYCGSSPHPDRHWDADDRMTADISAAVLLRLPLPQFLHHQLLMLLPMLLLLLLPKVHGCFAVSIDGIRVSFFPVSCLARFSRKKLSASVLCYTICPAERCLSVLPWTVQRRKMSRLECHMLLAMPVSARVIKRFQRLIECGIGMQNN